MPGKLFIVIAAVVVVVVIVIIVIVIVVLVIVLVIVFAGWAPHLPLTLASEGPCSSPLRALRGEGIREKTLPVRPFG